MPNVMDDSSRLAADTRAARDRVDALDRCGHPVPTVDRDAALTDYHRAMDAERAYWTAVCPEPAWGDRVVPPMNLTFNEDWD